MSRDFVKAGILWKTGPDVSLLIHQPLRSFFLSHMTVPKGKSTMRKRWFLLDQKLLYYYKEPLVSLISHSNDIHGSTVQYMSVNQDPFPQKKKAVKLGSASEGYSVEEGSGGMKLSQNYPLTLRTPSRTYHLAAENDEEQRTWIEAFQRVFRMPPGQDETGSIANGTQADKKSLSLNIVPALDVPPQPPPRPSHTLPHDFQATQRL